MSGFVVNGAVSEAPEGLVVKNFLEDGVVQFSAHGKRAQATEIIIHETVTTSVEATLAVLRTQGLSVHLVMGPDGTITQHADLASAVLWHAGAPHNGPSFGVEVVSPYYPRMMKRAGPWQRVIRAPWAHEGQYVLPTPAEAEAVARLIAWSTSSPAPGVEVPRVWLGLAGGAMQLGRVDRAAKVTPGILAHQYFGHADGAWLVLYAWLRLEAGLEPEEAFEQAAARATGVPHADIGDLMPEARDV